MRFPPKALPLVLQILDWNWRLSHWSCFPTYILCPTLVSSILEELSFYVIWLKELKLTFVLTYFKPWGKWQDNQMQKCVFPSVVLSWKSWFLKVSIHQKTELSCFINDQYQWCHSKWARVTLLLKGQSTVPPKLQKATPSNMPLLPNIDQMLLLYSGILGLHFLTLLSQSLLALSWDHLVLIPIGWQSWLRDYMSVFQVLLM